jgi:hypothetical protein
LTNARVEQLARIVGWSGARSVTPDWVGIEAELRLEVPSDFKALLHRFPDGAFMDCVTLATPDGVDFLGGYALVMDDLRTWKLGEPQRVPYPIYPDSGGILQWGGSDAGDAYFWLTDSPDPNKWPIVTLNGERDVWKIFDIRVVEFLLLLAEGGLDAVVVGRRVTGAPRFTPISEMAPVDHKDLSDQLFMQIDPLLSTPTINRVQSRNDFEALAAALLPMSPTVYPVGDWVRRERVIGSRLPGDYIQFMETFGAGVLHGIKLLVPGASAIDFDMVARLHALREEAPSAYAQMLERDDLDLRIHPVDQGAIPWGVDDGNNVYLWVPVGTTNPDDWQVGVVGSDFTKARTFYGSMTTFLLNHFFVESEDSPDRLDFVPVRNVDL